MAHLEECREVLVLELGQLALPGSDCVQPVETSADGCQ